MTLDEYLKGRSPKQLAEATGISMASLSRLRNGKQNPSIETLNLIFQKTEGLVTPNDFLGIAA